MRDNKIIITRADIYFIILTHILVCVFFGLYFNMWAFIAGNIWGLSSIPIFIWALGGIKYNE